MKLIKLYYCFAYNSTINSISFNYVLFSILILLYRNGEGFINLNMNSVRNNNKYEMIFENNLNKPLVPCDHKILDLKLAAHESLFGQLLMEQWWFAI